MIGGEEIDLFCKEELQVAEGSDDGENDDPLHLALKGFKANPARRSVRIQSANSATLKADCPIYVRTQTRMERMCRKHRKRQSQVRQRAIEGM